MSGDSTAADLPEVGEHHVVLEEWEHAADERPLAVLDAPMRNDHSIVILIIAAARQQNLRA